MSRLWTLGLYEANEPKKEGHEYGKSIFDSETEMIYSIENNQKVNQDFEVDGVKQQFDVKHVDDISLYDTSVNSKHHVLPQSELDPTQIKQLQVQDTYLSKIIAKCKSPHHITK